MHDLFGIWTIWTYLIRALQNEVGSIILFPLFINTSLDINLFSDGTYLTLWNMNKLEKHRIAMSNAIYKC